MLVRHDLRASVTPRVVGGTDTMPRASSGTQANLPTTGEISERGLLWDRAIGSPQSQEIPTAQPALGRAFLESGRLDRLTMPYLLLGPTLVREVSHRPRSRWLGGAQVGSPLRGRDDSAK